MMTPDQVNQEPDVRINHFEWSNEGFEGYKAAAN
jgi:hypothetical protein